MDDIVHFVKYFVPIFIVVVDMFAVIMFLTAISLGLPVVSNEFLVSYKQNIEDHATSKDCLA